MNDIYQSPQSELLQNEPVEGYGSVEKAIAGDYEFSIGGVVSEAWAKTSGCKWSVHLALAIYMLVMIAIMAVFMLLMPDVPSATSAIVIAIVEQVAITAVGMPIFAGIFMIGLKQSVGRSHSVGEIFAYFGKTLPIFIAVFIMYIMILLGFVLLIIPGIYLTIAYYFAVPLIVEKDLSPWAALETSRKAVTKRWFSFLGLGIVFMLINIVGMIPLGIGLIWTVPMSIVAYGIAYRNMFGVQNA